MLEKLKGNKFTLTEENCLRPMVSKTLYIIHSHVVYKLKQTPPLKCCGCHLSGAPKYLDFNVIEVIDTIIYQTYFPLKI